MIAEAEQWKAAPGYEGAYEVSDLGRIRGIARVIAWHGTHRRQPSRLLKQRMNTEGYPVVSLSTGEVVRTIRVHRLVALAFIGPAPSDRHEVAHGDGTRTNGRATNLRWATRAENMADAIAHGTATQGERSATAKLTTAQVHQIRELSSAGAGPVDLGKRFGVSRQTIYGITSGRHWGSV